MVTVGSAAFMPISIYLGPMDEKANSEIEWLQRIFEMPDSRPLTESDLTAANRRHDEKLANSPWFKLWQSFGVCCRPEPPALRSPES